MVTLGCPDNIAPVRRGDANTENGNYVPPEPVQLTPPRGIILDHGVNTSFNVEVPIFEIAVPGSKYKPMQAELAGSDGKRVLSVLVADDRKVEFAEADFHMTPAAATQVNGDIMICWNTLTGTSSEYNPNSPDPARGMALYCRLLRDDNTLSPRHRIHVPTVGAWLTKVAALDDGGFRLLYKGDDGWFEADHTNPLHGVYEAYYADGTWTTPSLVVPVPNPED